MALETFGHSGSEKDGQISFRLRHSTIQVGFLLSTLGGAMIHWKKEAPFLEKKEWGFLYYLGFPLIRKFFLR